MKILFAYLFLIVVLLGCTENNLFEKNVNIPNQEWKSNYLPSYTFNITDTISNYKMYLVFRHTEKYNYNNIWLDIKANVPGEKEQSFRIEKKLADNEHGFQATGSAMADVYEHRLPLTINAMRFNKLGNYTFKLQQIMREDPLKNVISVGLRVEKINQ